MGFGAAMIPAREREEPRRRAAQCQPEDLLKFGMIPEFIGRLPVIATLEELDERALDRHPDRAQERAGEAVPEALRDSRTCELRFTEGALGAIARQALARKSGARGLRAILETIMLELMYEIPSRDDVDEVIMSEEVIEQGAEPLLVLKNEAESA